MSHHQIYFNWDWILRTGVFLSISVSFFSSESHCNPLRGHFSPASKFFYMIDSVCIANYFSIDPLNSITFRMIRICKWIALIMWNTCRSEFSTEIFHYICLFQAECRAPMFRITICHHSVPCVWIWLPVDMPVTVRFVTTEHFFMYCFYAFSEIKKDKFYDLTSTNIDTEIYDLSLKAIKISKNLTLHYQ